MTLSNRFSLAGAIPLLVAVALAVVVAAIALAPSKPASAIANDGACDLSPLILEMLLERYGLEDHDCDNLDLETPGTLATGENDHTWDFSGQELSEFAISDDDADLLRDLTGMAGSNDADGNPTITAGASIAESTLRYIDLTDNPLTVDDVSFKHIPSNVALILSAESNVPGFQQSDYEVTEGEAGYISAAFPNLMEDGAVSITVTVNITGDSTITLNPGAGDGSGTREELVSFGTGAASARTVEANSEADDVIFYWPITVSKDNETDEDWDITFRIPETDGVAQTPETGGSAIATVAVDLDGNDEADITIIDADAPAVSVCDRSEDVQEAIMAVVAAANNDGTYGGTSTDPRDCDELTIRDIGELTGLTVKDVDTQDNLPIEDLAAGDFDNLAKLARLHIVGAQSLPSGIFAGVGKDATAVVITFDKNDPTDSDDPEAGNFTPSTIPQHIWDDQEKKQVINITDDKDDDGNGVTKGLDADLYAATENGYFFAMTNAGTADYILGSTVTFTTDGDAMSPTFGLASNDPLSDNLRGGGEGSSSSRVVRFAVIVPNVDDEDKGDRNMWLFTFADTDGATDPGSASDLKDLALVAITDDDV